MSIYRVYLNDKFLMYQLAGIEPTVEDLHRIATLEASSLQAVFRICNDPLFIIKRSLSIGDVIESVVYGNKFIVENIGFRRLDTPLVATSKIE